MRFELALSLGVAVCVAAAISLPVMKISSHEVAAILVSAVVAVAGWLVAAHHGRIQQRQQHTIDILLESRLSQTFDSHHDRVYRKLLPIAVPAETADTFPRMRKRFSSWCAIQSFGCRSCSSRTSMSSWRRPSAMDTSARTSSATRIVSGCAGSTAGSNRTSTMCAPRTPARTRACTRCVSAGVRVPARERRPDASRPMSAASRLVQ